MLKGHASRDSPRRHRQIAGNPLELQLPNVGRKVSVARVMTSGTVTTLKIGQSAAKR